MEHNHTHTNVENDVRYFAESAYITNDVVEALYALCETPEDKQKLVRLGFVKNDFEERAGSLTFSERKINFSSIEKSLDFSEEDLSTQLTTQIEEKKQEYLKEVEKTITAKDWIGLAVLLPTFGGRLSKSYADTMGNLFEVGKKTASNELQVASPATDRDIP